MINHDILYPLPGRIDLDGPPSILGSKILSPWPGVCEDGGQRRRVWLATLDFFSHLLGCAIAYKFLNGMHCRCVRFQISREASQVDIFRQVGELLVESRYHISWKNPYNHGEWWHCHDIWLTKHVLRMWLFVLLVIRFHRVYTNRGGGDHGDQPEEGCLCCLRATMWRKNKLLQEIMLVDWAIAVYINVYGVWRWASEWTATIWWFQKCLPSTFYLPNEWS